jgi:hypothetical protein
MELTWDRVLAWRMRRQHLDPVDEGSALAITRRLCGVQAQVRSSAAQAIAVRQASPSPDAAARALADRSLLRTWAMRGTLHLLPVDDAPDVLSLLAASRTWATGSWQKNFVTLDELAALTEAVTAALAPGDELTRDELVTAIVEHTGSDRTGEHVRSGWSAVLKPLAWQGVLCQGSAQGSRVTFVRPDAWSPSWPGLLPDPDEAAGRVILRYLGAFGPATAAAFDAWLLRGATSKPRLRSWFADLGDAITEVDVEGTTCWARAEDVDDIAATPPTSALRLLPAFDAYVLGPGTGDVQVVPAEHRGLVSRAAGWIAPVVVHRGRVVGTWEQDVVTPFPGVRLPARALAAEQRRWAALPG